MSSWVSKFWSTCLYRNTLVSVLYRPLGYELNLLGIILKDGNHSMAGDGPGAEVYITHEHFTGESVRLKRGFAFLLFIPPSRLT